MTSAPRPTSTTDAAPNDEMPPDAAARDEAVIPRARATGSGDAYDGVVAKSVRQAAPRIFADRVEDTYRRRRRRDASIPRPPATRRRRGGDQGRRVQRALVALLEREQRGAVDPEASAGAASCGGSRGGRRRRSSWARCARSRGCRSSAPAAAVTGSTVTTRPGSGAAGRASTEDALALDGEVEVPFRRNSAAT